MTPYGIPLSQILVDHNKNVRFEPATSEEIIATARSIEAEGQLHPAYVVGPTADNKYELLIGFTRYAALKHLCTVGSEALEIQPGGDYPLVAYILDAVEESNAVVAQLIGKQVAENIFRKEMGVMDMVRVIQRMNAAHASVETTMTILGLNARNSDDRTYYNRLASLIHAAPEVQQKIQEKLLSVHAVTTSNLLNLAEDAQREALAALEAAGRLKTPASKSSKYPLSGKATQTEVTAAVDAVITANPQAVRTPPAPRPAAKKAAKKAAAPRSQKRSLLEIVPFLQDRAANATSEMGRAIAAALIPFIMDNQTPEPMSVFDEKKNKLVQKAAAKQAKKAAAKKAAPKKK
jgi:ParB-like chromosome segregation protein Spo0J